MRHSALLSLAAALACRVEAAEDTELRAAVRVRVADRVNGCATFETQVLSGPFWYDYAHHRGCTVGLGVTDVTYWAIDRTGRCLKLRDTSLCEYDWTTDFVYGAVALAPECDPFEGYLPPCAPELDP